MNFLSWKLKSCLSLTSILINILIYISIFYIVTVIKKKQRRNDTYVYIINVCEIKWLNNTNRKKKQD